MLWRDEGLVIMVAAAFGMDNLLNLGGVANSSVGMAKSALEVVNGVNLFGKHGAHWSVIFVDIDAHYRNRTTVDSILARESASKVVRRRTSVDNAGDRVVRGLLHSIQLLIYCFVRWSLSRCRCPCSCDCLVTCHLLPHVALYCVRTAVFHDKFFQIQQRLHLIMHQTNGLYRTVGNRLSD